MSYYITSFLKRENFPFNLELLPQPAYIVGGAVRDGILGRKREYLDLDFVLPGDAVGIARKIAKHHQAGFVLLDAEREIARVVFAHATADFAKQEGDTLEVDLHRRDFTINAIAYNPFTQEIIDPLQGCEDIKAGILRMISPANLQDDPLRLLRAYRQASQLGFTIEATTMTTIRSLAPYVTSLAAERVRVEISYMLTGPEGTPWLKKAWEDHLLSPFFKNTTPERVAKLIEIDRAASLLTQTWTELGEKLSEYVRDTVKITWLGIAKLATLVSPDPEVAEIELQNLTYSRAEIRAVTTALRSLKILNPGNLNSGNLNSGNLNSGNLNSGNLNPGNLNPGNLNPGNLNPSEMSLREQFFFFQTAADVFPTTAILFVADDNNEVEAIAPLIARYLDPDDLVSHATQLVSGKDIILYLNIPSSPLVGELLTEIKVAQAEGKVSTPHEAIEFARQLMKAWS